MTSSVWAHILFIGRTYSVDKNPKRVSVIRLFVSSFGYFTEFSLFCGILRKNLNNEFLTENFAKQQMLWLLWYPKSLSWNRWFLFKISDGSRIGYFRIFSEKILYFSNVLSRKRSILLSWYFQNIIRIIRSAVKANFWLKLCVAFFFPSHPGKWWKCSTMIKTREERSNSMNPFRIFIYTMSTIYEQNMSSNRGYHSGRFPR